MSVTINLRKFLNVETKRTRTTKEVADLTINQTSPDKTVITVSQDFFNKADLQNNQLICDYEPGDNAIYFIVHNDEQLPTDFFKGKLVALKEEDGSFKLDIEGNKVFEMGKKSLYFQDKKLACDKTLVTLLSGVHTLDTISEFNLVQKSNPVFEDGVVCNITSVWEIVKKSQVVEVVSQEAVEVESATDYTESTEEVVREMQHNSGFAGVSANMPSWNKAEESNINTVSANELFA